MTTDSSTTTVRVRRARLFRRGFGIAAVVLGVGLPWLMFAALPPEQLGYAEIANPTQLLVSVFVPCVTALTAYDLKHTVADGYRNLGTLAATMGRAVGVSAALGLVASVMAALAVLAGGVAMEHAVLVGVGGVLLQAGAGLIGFGLGSLLGSPLLSCPATIVLPLGVFFVLHAVSPAIEWLAPFGAAQELLVAAPDAVWHWLVMVIVWAGALNASGILRARRR